MSRWIWVNEQFGIQDGQLCWQPQSLEGKVLDRFLPNLDESIKVTVERPETPETLLWSLSVPVPAADGPIRGFSQKKVGKVLGAIKWFATCRLYSPWFMPKHGKDRFEIDKDAVQVAFLRDDGLSVVLLALSGINDTAVSIRNNEDGYPVFNTQNDKPESSFGTVLVSVATSYEIANASVMYRARGLSNALSSVQEPDLAKAETQPVDDVDPKWYEEWVDGFGYCTWNSLGQSLNEQKILDALDGFRKDGIASKLEIWTLRRCVL
jgi:hypothetical protein